MLRMDL
jgi:hypothetical protein